MTSDPGPDGMGTQEQTDLEVQLEIDEIGRREGKDGLVSLLLLAAIVGATVVAPTAPVVAALMVLIVLLVATGTGFVRVRRTQRLRALEGTLEERRTRALNGAATSARRLAHLHDELDRKSSERGRSFEVLLSTLAAILLVTLGLVEGVSLAAGTGVFLGLFAAVRGRGELKRRAEVSALREDIHAIEVSDSP